jgi:hypothetical protein
MPQIGESWQDDLNFDYFHLGMAKYEWRYIPDPEGEMPKNLMGNWTFGDQVRVGGRMTSQITSMI